MAIIAKSEEKSFLPAPAGVSRAVCVDVEDRGLRETAFGLKEQVRLVWQLEEINPETQKPFVVSRIYTKSIHPKSTLGQHLELWRGKPFTDDERRGFDLEKLIGVNCQVQIVHKPTDEGRVWANVVTVIAKAKHAVDLKPVEYVRLKDRVVQAPPSDKRVPTVDEDEDPVPF